MNYVHLDIETIAEMSKEMFFSLSSSSSFI